MDGDCAIEDGAGRGWPFHGAGEPSAEGALGGFTAGCEDEENGEGDGCGAVEATDGVRPFSGDHSVPV